MNFRIAYLQRYESDFEAPNLEAAADVARRLAGTRPFGEVTILSVIPEGGAEVEPGEVIEEKSK